MPQPRDAAARLAAVLEPLLGANPNEQPVNVVQAWLGLEWPADAVRIYERLGDMHDLVRLAKHQVANLPDTEDVDLLSEAFPPLDQLVANLLTFSSWGRFSDVLAGLDRNTLTGLRHCSAALMRNAARLPVMATDTIEWLLGRLREMQDGVRQADDIDTNVKVWLHTRLRDIENALLNFDLSGVLGVAEANDRLATGLLRRGFLQAIRTSTVAAGLWTLIQAVDLAANLAANALSITGSGVPEPSPCVVVVKQEVDFNMTNEQLLQIERLPVEHLPALTGSPTGIPTQSDRQPAGD